MWGPKGLAQAPPTEQLAVAPAEWRKEDLFSSPVEISDHKNAFFKPSPRQPLSAPKSSDQLRKEREAKALFGGLVDDVDVDGERNEELL